MVLISADTEVGRNSSRKKPAVDTAREVQSATHSQHSVFPKADSYRPSDLRAPYIDRPR